MNSLPSYFKYLELDFLTSLRYDYNICLKYKKLYRGGGKTQTIKYKDIDDVEYVFTVDIEQYDKESLHISVVNQEKDECITVFVHPETKLAILHNLSYYKGCGKEGFRQPSNGSVLLRFIIYYLKKHKTVLMINKISLSDRSYIGCKKCDTNIKLARLRIITRGDTWYLANGFQPYDNISKGMSTKLLEYIKQNNEIIKTLQTSITDINKIVKMDKINKYNMDDLNRLNKKYVLLKDFINRLLKEYDKYCCLIGYIMDDIFDRPIGYPKLLNDLFNASYYMDI